MIPIVYKLLNFSNHLTIEMLFVCKFTTLEKDLFDFGRRWLILGLSHWNLEVSTISSKLGGYNYENHNTIVWQRKEIWEKERKKEKKKRGERKIIIFFMVLCLERWIWKNEFGFDLLYKLKKWNAYIMHKLIKIQYVYT